MNELLKALRENPEFKAVMEDLTKHRPIVPAFSICRTKDEQDMVIENIKFYTALKQGWDSLFTLLTGRGPTNVQEIQHGRAKADD